MRQLGIIVAFSVLAGCPGASEGYIVFNTPPAVAILEPAEDEIFEEEEAVLFRALVADNSGPENLEIQWTSSIDGILVDYDVPDQNGHIELATASLSVGSHVITVRATDPEAGQGEARVTIHIEGVPDHPTLEIVHPQVGEDGLEDWPFQFMARVSDRQDDPEDLVVEVESDPYGFVCYMVPDSNGVGTCSEELPLGQHLLTFTVTDLDEFSVSQTRAFRVVSIDDYDSDGDGFTPNGGDCNDNNAQIYPGAPEICDGFDNDCNPATAIDVGTLCYDDDGDGFCEAPPCVNTSATLPDCNDAAPYMYPGNTEVLDGYDNNCDGRVDEGTVKYDDDGDGYCESPPCVNATGNQSDCDDGNIAISPGVSETCTTAYDDDCDGNPNEQNALQCTKFYNDGDGDGYYKNGASYQCWCSSPGAPYTATQPNDCNDAVYNANPGQTQYFPYAQNPLPPSPTNRWDYNCDGQPEQEYPTSTTCYFQPFSCEQTGGGGHGWDGNVPSCGNQGTFIDGCSFAWLDFLAGCALGCATCWDCFLSGTNCSSCIACAASTCPGAASCDPDGPENKIQACR